MMKINSFSHKYMNDDVQEPALSSLKRQNMCACVYATAVAYYPFKITMTDGQKQMLRQAFVK